MCSNRSSIIIQYTIGVLLYTPIILCINRGLKSLSPYHRTYFPSFLLSLSSFSHFRHQSLHRFDLLNNDQPTSLYSLLFSTSWLNSFRFSQNSGGAVVINGFGNAYIHQVQFTSTVSNLIGCMTIISIHPHLKYISTYIYLIFLLDNTSPDGAAFILQGLEYAEVWDTSFIDNTIGQNGTHK